MGEPLHPLLAKYFPAAGEEECNLLKQKLEVRGVSKGEVLSAAGEKARYLYFILEGRFAVHKDIGVGRKTQAVALLAAGTVIGEAALTEKRFHQATVVAVEQAIVAGLSSQALEAIRTQMPELFVGLISKVLSITLIRLQKSSERLARIL
jgi:CRP-like cAMP-binding protein